MSNKNRKKFLSDEKIKEIKKRLIDLNLTQAKIAKDLRVSRMAVCYVVNGKNKSPRIRKYLEKKLGVKI